MQDEDDLAPADFTDATATFGDRVTAAREAQGLTVAQLSRQMGVRADTLQNWEADRSEPRANRLQMLAGVLNVPLAWLMTGQGEGPRPRPRAAAGVPEEVLAELSRIRADQQRLQDRLSRLIARLSA